MHDRFDQCAGRKIQAGVSQAIGADAVTKFEIADLACRLTEEGPFEIYRGLDDHKSKQVWLTEEERDAIVAVIWTVLNGDVGLKQSERMP